MIKVEPTAESLELQIGVTARGNRVAESLAAVKDEVNSSLGGRTGLVGNRRGKCHGCDIARANEEDTRDSSTYP